MQLLKHVIPSSAFKLLIKLMKIKFQTEYNFNIIFCRKQKYHA